MFNISNLIHKLNIVVKIPKFILTIIQLFNNVLHIVDYL